MYQCKEFLRHLPIRNCQCESSDWGKDMRPFYKTLLHILLMVGLSGDDPVNEKTPSST